MTLTIYGSPRSRTMRVLWMAAELGLEYRHVPYEADDPALKRPEFLALNPAGAIPTIVDDGFALAESMAINLYLANRYAPATGATLGLVNPQEQARGLQRSLWAQGHLEPWVQKDRLLADLIQAIGAHGGAMVKRSLSVLNEHLASTNWLAADRFTVADLNVAGVLSPSRSGTLDLSVCDHVSAWLARCYRRPAAVAVRQRYQG